MTPVSSSTASTALTPHLPQPGPSPVRGGDRSPDTCHGARDALQPSTAMDPGGPVDSEGELSKTPSPRPEGIPSQGEQSYPDAPAPQSAAGVPDRPLVTTTASPLGRHPRQAPTSRANGELARTRDITTATFDPRGSCHGQVRTVVQLRVRVLRLRWAGAAPPATTARSRQRVQQQPRRPTQHRYAALVRGTPANHPCAFPPVAM